ncbi:hypothetical protein A2801_01495 [Candidatus Woesebacteria bacterium RIFCSPHIGHO2_01_FULL_41_10]|uniref:Uncharacterized protein n=1 Tax=Candidatus Woesebacteria bacterium RIFCSPHIGHO2_01_FULL_41_10 TaxID=1802500 RepID=A0A1F7YR34_9BACT|nr:MAG: hypothetical protein A2801_01495 [Candidatus Woesebacteria bacterium RIFCSPHIGHO2_01_FULL_41_10]
MCIPGTKIPIERHGDEDSLERVLQKHWAEIAKRRVVFLIYAVPTCSKRGRRNGVTYREVKLPVKGCDHPDELDFRAAVQETHLKFASNGIDWNYLLIPSLAIPA